MKLFTKYEFEYHVSKDLLKMGIATDKLSVVATLVVLCDGIAPLVTIHFANISVLDIINISDWDAVKRECEVIAIQHFEVSANVIVPANIENTHSINPSN